jgi:hypothetical protein
MARKKTTKDYGDRQFNKMVKALKLSEEEVIDLIGGVRRNKKTGQIEHHKKGGPVVKARVGKGIQKGLTESYKAIADKLKARKSKPKKTTRSEAKLVEGSGDMSDPTNRAGRMRAGTQQRRGGATSQARDAISDTEKDKLARSKAARGSYKRSQKLKKGSLAQLSDEYDKLLKGRQRAERVKGSKSKYYKVFKARKMKGLKTGGPVVKARIGGILKAGRAIKKSMISGSGKPKKKTNPIEQIKKIRKKRPVRKPRKLGPVGSRDNAPINMGFMERAIRNQDIDTKDVQKLTPYQYKKMLEETPFQPKLKRRKSGAARKKAGGGPIIEKKFGKAITKALKKGTKSLKKATKKNPNIRNPIKKRGYNIFDRLQKHMTGPSGPKRNKKGGGKITYRMTGGQVVDAGYD